MQNRFYVCEKSRNLGNDAPCFSTPAEARKAIYEVAEAHRKDYHMHQRMIDLAAKFTEGFKLDINGRSYKFTECWEIHVDAPNGRVIETIWINGESFREGYTVATCDNHPRCEMFQLN